MGTNCAPLVADLVLFCYERDFMRSLSDDKQADIIDAFNTDRSKAVLLLWVICVICFVFVMLSHLLIVALWSPEGKGLTSWLLFVMFIEILLLSHLVSWDRCGT